MKEFLVWWIGIEAVGLAAFPLTYAFLRWLPDRGFAFSKVIGLLLLGYGVWAGAVVGVISNSQGSIILVLLLIAGLSALVAGRHRADLAGVLRSGWRYMVFVEVLFLAVLAAAVFLRSFAPEIIWGEKPFELAFLNSIARGDSFPPNDPWLSGQSISYYYFGYVMIAVLTKLVALSTATTFYLGLSLIAALASVATFGLVYNMIAVSHRQEPAPVGAPGPGAAAPAEGPSLMPRAVVFGLAGAGLMAIVSNLAGVFELMARHGVGSRGFYSFVGIFDLNGTYNCGGAPGDCTDWFPTRFWWWWKATRIGSPFDIQEFPFFSFQFGDLHPHVLVMPFLITLLAVAFAIVLRARRDGGADGGQGPPSVRPSVAYPWRSLLLALLVGLMVLFSALALDVSPVPLAVLTLAAGGLQFFLGVLAEGRATKGGPERLDALWWLRSPGQYLLLALLLGGVVFIDAWAMPLALMATLAAAVVANWIRTGGRPLLALGDSVGFAVPIAAAMIFFYLPFHINQELEVNGLNITRAAATPDFPPANSEATRPLHFLLFWGPLLWLGFSFLAVHLYTRRREVAKLPLVALAAILWAVPLAIWLAWILGRGGVGGVVDELSERGGNLVTILILVVAVTAVALALLHQIGKPAAEQDRGQLFVFLLAAFAFLMLLGAELFFVNDLFHWRANTVFRFWHESWIILSIVGGFGLYRLTRTWRMPQARLGSAFWPRLAVAGVVFGAVYTVLVAVEPWDVLYAKWWTATLGLFVGGASVVGYLVAAAVRDVPGSLAWGRVSWVGVTAVVLAGALVYPVTVTFERTGGFRNSQSLNGLVHVERGRPAEFEAIEYLTDSVSGAPVIVEAVDRSYSDGARISSRTGLPAVLGWPGHESVWRSSDAAFAGREDDVRRIYETMEVSEARQLLDKYGVEYVYVGYLERDIYGEAGLAKFREFMTPVFENDGVTIYRLLEQAAVARSD